jgi:hypothetical protein
MHFVSGFPEAKEAHSENQLVIIEPKQSQEPNSDESISDSDAEDDLSSNSWPADHNLFDESSLTFELEILPHTIGLLPSVNFISETASRLLFKTVHWLKSIPSFGRLKPALQTELVQRSWSSLFVLGLAQISGQVSIPSLLSLVVSHQQARLSKDPGVNVKSVVDTVCKIHKYINALVKLGLDDTEFAYLKVIVLCDGHQLQEAALSQLQEYLVMKGRERTRFPKLLLLLSLPRSLQPLAVEELFFAGEPRSHKD